MYHETFFVRFLNCQHSKMSKPFVVCRHAKTQGWLNLAGDFSLQPLLHFSLSIWRSGAAFYDSLTLLRASHIAQNREAPSSHS